MDIIINTCLVLLIINIWTLIGFVVISIINYDYEIKDNLLLSSFAWIVILAGWIVLQFDEYLDKKLKI